MEYKGLWEDRQKKPMKVFVVTESDDDFTENVICDSYLSAHFEFQERVKAVKEDYGDKLDDDEYVITEGEDYFTVYREREGDASEIEIYIKEQDVVSY